MPTKTRAAEFSSDVLVAETGGFAFARVPAELSRSHLRRGRITASVTIGASRFDAQMEPDGQLGHWFVVPPDVARKERIAMGHRSTFVLSRLAAQPEPALPARFKALLDQSPAARATWASASALAKIDWVHWMESAKQDATRNERASSAIDMLEKGKKRVCCFDPSGYFSKALACPAAARDWS